MRPSRHPYPAAEKDRGLQAQYRPAFGREQRRRILEERLKGWQTRENYWESMIETILQQDMRSQIARIWFNFYARGDLMPHGSTCRP